MSERTAVDTRDRILATALDLFARQGYQRTSLREIAERVGLTKPAILYHFPAKDRLMAELIEPLLQDLEAAVDAAERLEPGVARLAILERILDTYLKHRRALLTLRHDISIIARQPYFQRFMRIPARTIEIVAGPAASLPERVRAAQALSLLGDPLVFFPDAPDTELRALVLAGVHRLLADDGTGAARGGDGSARGGDGGRPGRARGRRAGRPPALNGEQLHTARRLYRAGSHSVEEIAAALGVSRATVYRGLAATATVSKHR